MAQGNHLLIHGEARELIRQYVQSDPKKRKKIEEEDFSAIEDAFYHIFWCMEPPDYLCSKLWQKLKQEHPEPEIQKWLSGALT